jgi:1,4-alpha-glucan branching enzyme
MIGYEMFNRPHWAAACAALVAAVGTVEAAPTWMGVYGSYQRHDGSNPGTYTVLMNQDYWGLHAEVGVRVNGGSWTTHQMTYAGHTSGNSVWTYTPASAVAPGSTVEYYFHGYDDWGAHIWDNNGGANHTHTAALVPSAKAGMGAWADSGDTTFRVWAPNATSVSVAGSFNAWSATANPLAAEAGGTWSVDVPGDQRGETYKYVINGTLWKNDPRATDVTNSVGDSIVTAPTSYAWSTFSMPGWHELVIYEMHIGTYNDTPGGNPGTWQSAISKLDHLQDMGINAVEVLPIAEFAGDFSWGYNPAHPFAPESIYGDPDDIKDFVDECHQRGIAVIVDVVYNHLGPSDLDMWRFDGSSTGPYGGIYFFQDWRAPTPWGDTRP